MFELFNVKHDAECAQKSKHQRAKGQMRCQLAGLREREIASHRDNRVLPHSCSRSPPFMC